MDGLILKQRARQKRTYADKDGRTHTGKQPPTATRKHTGGNKKKKQHRYGTDLESDIYFRSNLLTQGE